MLSVLNILIPVTYWVLWNTRHNCTKNPIATTLGKNTVDFS